MTTTTAATAPAPSTSLSLHGRHEHHTEGEPGVQQQAVPEAAGHPAGEPGPELADGHDADDQPDVAARLDGAADRPELLDDRSYNLQMRSAAANVLGKTRDLDRRRRRREDRASPPRSPSQRQHAELTVGTDTVGLTDLTGISTTSSTTLRSPAAPRPHSHDGDSRPGRPTTGGARSARRTVRPKGRLMLRSLYAGISGLRAEQTMLDVTSNNIANVNTVGFKSSSVQFEDTLSQTLSAAGLSTQRQGAAPTRTRSVSASASQASARTSPRARSSRRATTSTR